MLTVEMVIDLHAADVDQLGSSLPSSAEIGHRILDGTSEIGLAFDVHRERAQAALAARFRQTDRIEYPLRYSVFGGCRLYLPLAGSGIDRGAGFSLGYRGRSRCGLGRRCNLRSAVAGAPGSCREERQIGR